jgi:hypothetical protein
LQLLQRKPVFAGQFLLLRLIPTRDRETTNSTGRADKRIEPINASGHKLVTLRDTAQRITKLPEAEHDAEEWQAASMPFCWLQSMTDHRCSSE